MNNLNDPTGWNIRPGPREDGENNKWNYALLVPMLCLAAFRWIWTRESQRQIREVEAGCDGELKAASSQLDAKYREAVTECCQEAARMELELERERQRVKGYRQALHSQGQQVLEERKQLQQEREALEEEKREIDQRGPAAVLLRDALGRQHDWQLQAAAVLRDFEAGLVERQSALCNAFLPRRRRLVMERNLLLRAAEEPLARELNMDRDLMDIFINDRHCADLLNTDRRQNGSLMWVYLRVWQLQVTLQTHKRAHKSLQGVEPDPNHTR
ncbi:hypothetical protein AGOR_G00113630 [Albula goreensis]|uniref:Coiled-coil domain-containing protein 127 n=1 Tax=Albula goreensis TaxID=1534307 RepID=A0A8T3DIR8_9TELE|nr:hypothetical protein AGOR_G00113630 [Albula goreensis]